MSLLDMNREFGEILTISVGTALAFEEMLKTEKTFPEESLFLNLRTLARNFLGSFKDLSTTNGKVLTSAFIEEINSIIYTVPSFFENRLKLFIYFPTYKSVESNMKDAKLKEASTPKQVETKKLEDLIMGAALSDKKLKELITTIDTVIEAGYLKALFLTHLPIDLIAARGFRSIRLLESHTGAIKSPSEWMSKLTNNEKYSRLPFNVLTIQLIGDKSTMFQSLGPKWVKPVVELAESRSWSQVTKMQKVKFDIRNHIRDKFLAAKLLKMTEVKFK